MKPSCRYCRPALFVPLFALLAFTGLIGSCSSVQSDVRQRTLSALQAAGLSGIQVNVGYRDVKMTGPPDLGASAVAAVSGLGATHDVTYIGSGSSTATPTPTTIVPATVTTEPAEPTTTRGTAVPSIRISGSMTSGAITLNGTVTDEDVHAAVTGAAAAAYGAGNVTDDIAVVGAVTAPDLSAAANALAAILATLPGNLETGTFELVDTTLSLSGVASGIDALDAINEAAASATGVEVTADLGAAPDAVIDSLSGLLELEPITFETNSDVITAESQTTLDKSAGYLRAAFIANPGLRVEIGGHTDDHGDPVYNLELSNRRASAVLQYLTDHGVPATGLTATGYGMDRPIADNATADGRAQNRRIEFTILEG